MVKESNMQTMDDFNVGDGVSTYINGDYYPFTVIGKKGKRLIIQSDQSRCVKPNSDYGSDDAEFEFDRDPNGHIEIWSLRKSGRFKRTGDSINSWFGLTQGRYNRRNPHI